MASGSGRSAHRNPRLAEKFGHLMIPNLQAYVQAEQSMGQDQTSMWGKRKKRPQGRKGPLSKLPEHHQGGRCVAVSVHRGIAIIGTAVAFREEKNATASTGTLGRRNGRPMSVVLSVRKQLPKRCGVFLSAQCPNLPNHGWTMRQVR